MDIKEWYSQLGKKSAASLTPEQRQARARKAINTRWGKDTNSKYKDLTAKHAPIEQPRLNQCAYKKMGNQCPSTALSNNKYCFTHKSP